VSRSTRHDPGERPVVRLLGPLAVDDGLSTLGAGDLGGVRPKQVLEILLAARGHRVSTDRLAELLWGDTRPDKWAASIQTFISVLRRRLTSDGDRARELVITEPAAYRFATDLVDLDLDRFDELVERSSREPTHRSRLSLEHALALVQGEVLEDEPYATWAQELRGTYHGRVLGARLDAADAALAEFDYSGALAHVEAAIVLDQFSERAQRIAMVALYALGRQHEALAAYRAFRARLDEELGLEPTADTRALEAAILRQEDIRRLLPRPIHRAEADARPASLRLLGRGGELDELERAVRRALDGSFALLLIEGEVGLGKTRLLDELAVSLIGTRTGRASCSRLAQHLPYVPLAAALRDALGDTELDPRRLQALGPILPELTLGNAHRRYGELEALEALVALIDEHGPLVLLIDDLQWAEPATLAALHYLQHRCAGPAAVVGTVRVGATTADHPLRSLQPDLLVALEPLTAGDLAPLGLPDLHATTGGNPRFVADAVANGSQPELSADLAQALLDQCRAEGAQPYRILLAASALDQPFEPELLAALVPAEATEILEELERLCERRILRVDGLRFRFRYDLVRQVLLASLSPARRRLLQTHLKPAERGVLVALGQTSQSIAG
jgi:DNA-binding SARP family transcriptional activator